MKGETRLDWILIPRRDHLSEAVEVPHFAAQDYLGAGQAVHAGERCIREELGARARAGQLENDGCSEHRLIVDIGDFGHQRVGQGLPYSPALGIALDDLDVRRFSLPG